MATRSITTYGAAFTLQVSVPDSDLLIISLLKVTHNPSSAFTLYVVSLRPEVDVTGKGSQKGAICDGRRRKCKSSFCFLQHIETQAKHRALKAEERKKEKTESPCREPRFRSRCPPESTSFAAVAFSAMDASRRRGNI